MMMTAVSGGSGGWSGMRLLLRKPAEEGGRGQLQIFVTRMEVPRPALRGEGEVKNPARRSPGGRREEATIHLEPLFSLNIFGFSHLAVTSVSRSCDKISYTVN